MDSQHFVILSAKVHMLLHERLTWVKGDCQERRGDIFKLTKPATRRF